MHDKIRPNARTANEPVKTVKPAVKKKDTQIDKTLQGVIVNTYIKDNDNVANAPNMDDICNSLVIPDKFYAHSVLQNEPAKNETKKKNNSLLKEAIPFIASALCVAGTAAVLSSVFKHSAPLSRKLPRGLCLPDIGINYNLNEEHYFATYMALKSPDRRSKLAMIGVFLMGGLTIIGKNLVDGIQKIWIKKQEADVNKDLQESYIDIETRAFAGKLDVTRQELINKANYFKTAITLNNQKIADKTTLSTKGSKSGQKDSNTVPMSIFDKFISFTGKTKDETQEEKISKTKNETQMGSGAGVKIQTQEDGGIKATNAASEDKKQQNAGKKKDWMNSPWALALVSAVSLVAVAFLAKFTLRNISKGEESIMGNIRKNTDDLNAKIKSFIKCAKEAGNEEQLQDGLKGLKQTLVAKHASREEAAEAIKKTGIYTENKEKSEAFVEDVVQNIMSTFSEANEMMGGKPNQVQPYIYINEPRGYIYNWIVNPENPFNKLFFLAMSTVGACGYSIHKALDSIKDAAVIKENANTEKDLQNRLVDTEIRNFKSKKESAIEPMMIEFNNKLKEGKSNEELKTMADSILLEIKNGPPFVYA